MNAAAPTLYSRATPELKAAFDRLLARIRRSDRDEAVRLLRIVMDVVKMAVVYKVPDEALVDIIAQEIDA